MRNLIIDNHVITTDLMDILYDIQRKNHSNKLQFFKLSGTGIQVQCPFHAEGHEKHGSCYINLNNENIDYGVFHCFTCGERGGFGKFVGACFNRDQSFGNRWLLENYSSEEITSSASTLEKIILKPKEKKEEIYLDESILDLFESYHPYMTQRKLDQNTIKEFEIKYDPETKSIVFPVRDINGNLVGLTKRSVEGKKFYIDRGLDKKNVYLLNKAKTYKQVIVCESQLDSLLSWQYGFPAVALFGAGTTYEQIEVLRNTDIIGFVLMYDNDPAGRKGAEKFKRLMKNKFITDIVMPKGKDINDLTKEEFWNILHNNLVYIEEK